MSTAGAKHLAESAQWMAAELEPPYIPETHPAVCAPLIETAVLHMDPERTLNFLRWLQEMREA